MLIRKKTNKKKTQPYLNALCKNKPLETHAFLDWEEAESYKCSVLGSFSYASSPIDSFLLFLGIAVESWWHQTLSQLCFQSIRQSQAAILFLYEKGYKGMHRSGSGIQGIVAVSKLRIYLPFRMAFALVHSMWLNQVFKQIQDTVLWCWLSYAWFLVRICVFLIIRFHADSFCLICMLISRILFEGECFYMEKTSHPRDVPAVCSQGRVLYPWRSIENSVLGWLINMP